MKMKSTKRIKKIGYESKRRRKNLEDDPRHLQARLQVHPHHRKESYPYNPRLTDKHRSESGHRN